MGLSIWPSDLATGLEGLQRQLEPDLSPTVVHDIRELDAPGSEDDAVVLVLTGHDRAGEGLEWLRSLAHDSPRNVIAVVDDSYLGSGVDRLRAADSGQAVSIVRSLAVARGTAIRANAVCVPESLTGEGGEPRGPLSHSTNAGDVAEAIRLFAGDDGRYLSGQVLFVNGGRQLFSSHTS